MMYDLGQAVLLAQDNLPTLKTFGDCWFDSIVTDPPYGLGLMGLGWDASTPTEPVLTELLRVAKPGAHGVFFGGTRTFHHLTTALERAGWEIRDVLCWLYGSGMPKGPSTERSGMDGRGTCLKPAWEPIILVRKPFRGTLLSNLHTHGTGALQIDDSRIPVDPEDFAKLSAGVEAIRARGGTRENSWSNDSDLSGANPANPLGRWPSNVLLDECAAEAIDSQSGERPGMSGGGQNPVTGGNTMPRTRTPIPTSQARCDFGGASRFLYAPKASKAEKNQGCSEPNTHPTVKPVSAMRWLVDLITPHSGVVLDPWMGSGSTGVAAVRSGREFLGIDLDESYVKIAHDRIKFELG